MFERLGIEIKKALIMKDITQEEFATKLGISGNHLSLIIHGKNRPSLELLEKMCQELDLQILIISKNNEINDIISQLSNSIIQLSAKKNQQKK